MMLPLAVVLTTIDDPGRARVIARALVEEGLVACAQVESSPIHSVWRWEGAVEDGTEYRIMLKLPAAGVQRLRARFLELHPYETPEFVVLDARASDAYARWAEESCS